MPSSFEDQTVRRLNNSTWSCPIREESCSYREIHLRLPKNMVTQDAYTLACLAARHLKQHSPLALLERDLHFESPSLKRWKIALYKHERGVWRKILQFFPFTRTIINKKILAVAIKPTKRYRHKQVGAKKDALSISFNPDLPLSERLLLKNFQDPFTELASHAFQTTEVVFIAQNKLTGSFRFFLDSENMLHLVPMHDEPTDLEREENRKVLAVFYQFIVQEYGMTHISYLEQAYGFFFSEMIKEGAPLLPDHVFKVNIGVNMIHLSHVETFYEALCRHDFTAMSIRQLRGVMRATKNISLEDLLGSNPPKSVQKLSQSAFNQVVDMLMPTHEEREYAFTGRKIVERAVCGWTAKEDLYRESLANDLFEILHLFEDLQNNDAHYFCELLAHVLSKRNLFSSHIQDGEIVIFPGLLIPAPTSKSGIKRWYYSEALVSDQQGNFHYILLPACENYRTDDRLLPMIKLYRSTVSECNNIDWVGGLKADFNPYGPPCPFEPDRTLHYERLDFETRTIPLWVAYLEFFIKMKEDGKSHIARSALQASFDEFSKLFPELVSSEYIDEESSLYHFLYQKADEKKELVKYKICSDIAFVGHSLGGTLCEYYLAKRRDRVPLPGCSFLCYSANAPVIDDALDKAFMRFGRTHKALFQGLQIRFKVLRQFEHGDIFVQGGGTHLGTTGYCEEEDAVWLEQYTYVFKPLEGAEALTMTTLPTHGRRIGGAVRDKDYALFPITPKELYDFHHTWWLSSKEREIFGFRIFQSPMGMEKFRRVFSRLIQPFLEFLERREKKKSKKIANRDRQGILFARYSRPLS